MIMNTTNRSELVTIELVINNFLTIITIAIRNVTIKIT